jgi:integrase
MDYTQKLNPRLISGKWSIQGTVPVLGRIRKQYPTRDIALLESQKFIAKVSNSLAGSEIRETLLSKEEEKDSQSALNILQSNDKFRDLNISSLSGLAMYFVKHVSVNAIDIDLVTAGKSYISYLTGRERGENYLGQVSNKLAKMYRFLGEEFLVKDITKAMIKDWCEGRGISPFLGKEVTKTTRSGELTFFKGFFNYCVGEDWIESSPCEGIKSFGKNKKMTVALNLEDSEKIMRIAESFSGEAVCYFALSLFAGLRPEELRPKDEEHPLDWSDFIWREKDSTLEVSYLVGKVTTRRVVLIPENCVAWIKPHAKDSGPVIESTYAQWRGIKDYIRAKAGYRVYGTHFKHIDMDLSKVSSDTSRPQYIRDVLRHSAITYRLELRQNKDEVSNWAGNSPAVIDEHYRALVKGTKELTPKQYAKAYFQIMPK